MRSGRYGCSRRGTRVSGIWIRDGGGIKVGAQPVKALIKATSRSRKSNCTSSRDRTDTFGNNLVHICIGEVAGVLRIDLYGIAELGYNRGAIGKVYDEPVLRVEHVFDGVSDA